MKLQKRSLLFTYIILAIAVLEGLVVLYDIVHPFKDDFKLASVQYDVPSRDITVRPFLFEMHTAESTGKILDDISQQIAYTLIPKISTLAMHLLWEQKETENTNAVSLPDEPQKPAQPQMNYDVPLAPENNLLKEEKTSQLTKGQAYVAIVIDDMGLNAPNTDAIINIKKPMTAAFLTYGSASKEFAMKAKSAGFEVMLHVPMMPHVPASLAPITLSPKMSKDEVQKLFRDMIAMYDGVGIKGVNNHMGSLFTENRQSMGYIMEILQEKKMFFLDSKTTGKSVCRGVAAQYDVPYIARDVFLDNENNYDYIMGQLRQTEKVALKYGKAVAIGHPHTQTVRALADWVKTVDKKNIKLVHISDLIAKKL